jgi:ubiquinone/menaquinone biosynthesis C-methylase UbiE
VDRPDGAGGTLRVVQGTVDDRAYWDSIAAQVDRLPDGWRRRARAEHLELVHRWVGEPRGRWLKTDLFEERDEARALLPHLGTASWVGMDLSAAVVRRRRDRGTVAADVRRLPFRDGSFDGVLSTSTLDHFDDGRDIERSLAELHRVLVPGGLLILTLDNPRNPLIRMRNALPDRVARRTGLVPFAVGATMDEADGRRALGEAGFAVVDAAHLLHVPHVVGTRLASWSWYERRVLPRFARLAGTRAAPWTGHFVAFLARRSAPLHGG